ncbi:hypothetical protein SYK_07030 [Pseudodesulfovibrio nedwellii]|uniref:Replication terminator protein n=1 Tax=Pseudodesulfovibrio nedwellii TaxID=2973072 RepID=A0ABN6S2J6_9BACT|nr:hypothetical protein [Pseudodesulfovibrio nedwellii]BDQ36343.1 hypothetical protein SYK_07030 [Pseudodesulfovibrio nedwellii]
MAKDKLSLATLGQGAAVEQFDIALGRALENILDVNTDGKAKRKVTLEVTLKPNADRNMANVSYQVKSKLANDEAIDTTFMFGKDGKGKVNAMELFSGQMPGQGLLPGVDPVTGEVLGEQEEDGTVINFNRKEGTNND